MNPESEDTRGRWFGNDFCPLNGTPPIDGCYFCGRAVKPGPHNHTQIKKDDHSIGYSCVCDYC